MYHLDRKTVLNLLVDQDKEVLSLRIGARKIGTAGFAELAEGIRFEVDGKTLELTLGEVWGAVDLDELRVRFGGKDARPFGEKSGRLTVAGGLLALYGGLQIISVRFLTRYFPVESEWQMILNLSIGALFIVLGGLVIWRQRPWPGYAGIGVIVVVMVTNLLLGTLSFSGAIIPLVVIYVLVKNLLAVR